MKNIMLIVSALFTVSSLAVAGNKKTADIQFAFQGQAASLMQAYNDYETNKLDAFFDIFSTKNGASVDRSVLCVKATANKNAIQEIINLDYALDAGPFEEFSLVPSFSGDTNYPVKLTLNDDPNSEIVSTVNVQFCAY